MIKKFRTKLALKFGKLEHRMSRVCFVFLIFSIGAYKIGRITWALYSSIASGISWIIYWTSHRLEKWLYPSNFRRG